jgi:adenylate cyclase
LNPAGATVLGRREVADNIFDALAQATGPGDRRDRVLRFHIALAKRQGLSLARIAAGLAPEPQHLIERLHAEASSQPTGAVCHVSLDAEAGQPAVSLYAAQFREGMLFVHVPRSAGSDERSSFLETFDARPEAAGKRRPVLSEVVVLAVDLHDAARIWSALPAEEYFELINQIWLTAEPVFARHHGMSGKHPGDGLVCYFLPQRETHYVWNALLAADEMRTAMRRVSKEWQLRKGWTTELYLNMGLDEGQQWLGALKAAGQAAFTMFGESLSRAARLSDFARHGAVWATKNLIVKLSGEHKARLRYGVHRRDKEGRDVFVSSVFSTVDRLADVNGALHPRLQDIARVPITEILDIAAAERRREAPADAHQN